MSNDAGPIVVIVQADDDNRAMYATFLRRHGLATVAVASAADALAVAPTADVVVTGLLRSQAMSGVELIRRLRAEPRTKSTPIIVVTASVFPADRERAERAGCDMFLPMPCLPEQLLRAVRLVLAQPRGRRLSRRLARAAEERAADHARSHKRR